MPSSDPATLVVDRLFEAFNAQDSDGVAGVFGDDVLYVLHNTGEELVGAEAVTFFEGYFGRETGERITDPFHAPDGRTYFHGRFADSYGSSAILVFDVEMDGDRLVSMGDRQRESEEYFAAGAIDRLYEAFNDQDIDQLTEELEGMTYRSPSGVEFTGVDAAEHWADSFGSVVTRTTGVFAIGNGAYGFVTEHRAPDSDRSTAYTVEVERSDGRITSMTERRLTS
ncbi:nuclear transport factor 2 family protein [Nitriliruptor alkaliphilus]|uniref:nuclear transport factor 2 family protein n=1 Tax=Nitriliruptor alkaliphilus TaxID=427918 RepID=UPI0012EE457C|nr:nuclear transport factor 2 family protein [Nitriliruptor alkaliphilus]